MKIPDLLLKFYSILLIGLMLSACCGDETYSDGCGSAIPEPGLYNDNNESWANSGFVGVWFGTIEGSGGAADLTIELYSDGAITIEGDTNYYSLLTGSWNATALSMNATANSGSTLFDFVADVSGNTMTGTWAQENGDSGTFYATLQ